MPEDEIWKDIPDYPHYQVSNKGRVRSTGYWLEHGCKGGHMVRQYYPPRILSYDSNTKTKHRRVCLCNADGKKRVSVHVLVARVFIGPCPEGMEVCHNDGNPENNCVENLRYDTRQENQRDKFRMRRFDRQKLTEEDIVEIRKALASGERTIDIANRFGVGRRQIYYIRSGQQWGWSHKEVV